MRNNKEKLLICMILLVLIASFSIVSLLMQRINTNVDDFSFSVPNLSAQDTYWPSNASKWSEVAPETQGLDSDKISEMFDFIETASINIHSIIIVRNGYLLTYEYLNNYQRLENKSYSENVLPKSYSGPIYHDQASVTKSIISILIGIALQEGFLDNLSQTLYEFFADIWEPTFVDSELKKNITIEQLLTMSSGLVSDGDPSYPDYQYPPDDSIKLALEEVPLEFTPGEEGEFRYNDDGPNLLSGIITNVTGKSAGEFAKEYLFTPLGISEEEYYWPHDTKNISYGGYEFHCSPKVQAKIGMLCLNNGTWNGTQIVHKEYMKNATTPWSGFDSINYYGYLWWLEDGLIEAAGGGGQSIYINPIYNITVGITGSTSGLNYNTLLNNFIFQFAADNAPGWDQIPEDQLIQEGDSFFYDVNASDTSGVEYSINDNVKFNITSEGIITNSSSLSVGIYPLEIRAFNSFNNSITATINLRVESISSNNAIPGFDFNMILIMVLCTSAVLIYRRKKTPRIS